MQKPHHKLIGDTYAMEEKLNQNDYQLILRVDVNIKRHVLHGKSQLEQNLCIADQIIRLHLEGLT